jgi:hypothetical protein
LLSLFCTAGFALDPNRTLTQYVHRIWQLPQGLPDATITSILQTHDGYLWLGTETGLVRFDGVRFSRLEGNAQDPLSHLWIRNIQEDERHEMWVGTNEAGLFRLENGVATQYMPKRRVPARDRTVSVCRVRRACGHAHPTVLSGGVKEGSPRIEPGKDYRRTTSERHAKTLMEACGLAATATI